MRKDETFPVSEYASLGGHLDIMLVLIEHGARLREEKRILDNSVSRGYQDILDFFLRPEPRDLTVTSTGFWVVGLIKSLVSFLLFFTTNFFPFLSFITTFPILFDFAPNTPLSSDLRSLERLFPWRLSWRFWFRSFAIRSICKAETKKSCLKVVYNPSDSICMHPFNYVSRKHATTSEVPWFRISFLSTSKCIYI